MEARTMGKCKSFGIRAPALYFVDVPNGKIYMEHLSTSITVKEHIFSLGRDLSHHATLMASIGKAIAKMHSRDLIQCVPIHLTSLRFENTDCCCLE